MKIQNTRELKEYFRNSKRLQVDAVLVSTKIRRTWLLNHEEVIIRGKVYYVQFFDMAGGVWRATIVGGAHDKH